MRKAFLLVSLVVVLAAPSAVYALATESLGNAPIAGGWGFDGKLLTIVNVQARVYWYEVNGNPSFFFKGGSKELNEALKAFAALPGEKKEIILVAGPGQRTTLGGKPVAFDWSVHVPMGLTFGGDSDVADTRSTFTIHIPLPRPAAPADLAKVKQWIADLASDDFKTRAKGSAELEALGPSAIIPIRAALNGKISADVRDRLERVLGQVSGSISLDALQLPEGVSVVGVEALLERSRKERSNSDHHARGIAASHLLQPGVPANEVVPDFKKILEEEKHEYPIRCAASTASILGLAGKPLLPALRELLKSADKNVVNAAQYAIDKIEKATEPTTDEAGAKTRATIRAEIRELVKAQHKK